MINTGWGSGCDQARPPANTIKYQPPVCGRSLNWSGKWRGNVFTAAVFHFHLNIQTSGCPGPARHAPPRHRSRREQRERLHDTQGQILISSLSLQTFATCAMFSVHISNAIGRSLFWKVVSIFIGIGIWASVTNRNPMIWDFICHV